MKRTLARTKKKKIVTVSITQAGNCFGKFSFEGAVNWATRLLVTFG